MFIRGLRLFAPLIAITTLTGCATASSAADVGAAPACAPDARVAPTVELWLANQPVPALDLKNAEEARCFRSAFLKKLQPRLGEPVGYKVGLYSKAARAAYRTDEPKLGFLYAKMMIPNGGTAPANYAFGATWESDLLLVVKDDGLNTASTREEIYSHLRGYRPFIELPARNYALDASLNAEQVEALNVGAHLGVVGDEVALPQTPEGMAALVNFAVDVTIAGPDGTRTESGVAIETLGDVLEIARFARDRVLAQGGRLKAGDLLSVGVVTPARAPAAGQSVTIRYRVLPTPDSVSVNFR
jgi:2-keto-4-pentenoate hydratase